METFRVIEYEGKRASGGLYSLEWPHPIESAMGTEAGALQVFYQCFSQAKRGQFEAREHADGFDIHHKSNGTPCAAFIRTNP